MRITVRPYKNRKGMVEVDFTVPLPNGDKHRVRKVLQTSKSAALRWGEEQVRLLLTSGLPHRKQEVPTLKEFAPQFLSLHANANRQKPSSIASKETILRVHLVPVLGNQRLDAITSAQVQQLKLHLKHKARKTVNNVLNVLSVLLKAAVELGVLEQLPCTIRLLPTVRKEAAFHDAASYERLLQAARDHDWRTHLVVLLGGKAGLRVGEIVALAWKEVDWERGVIHVRASDWKGQLTSPKHGACRTVAISDHVAATLRQYRHLRSERVVCREDGRPLTRQGAWSLVRAAARQAQVPTGVHILRHTFCSLLAMKGANMRTVQELVGHRDLALTQRYTHVTREALQATVRLLDSPPESAETGGIVEAVPVSLRN
ncbi:MAG: site-specific integrase [Acidobacteria bacterium]|nr:site-specific integrase [Acidobacteriota bacterium]